MGNAGRAASPSPTRCSSQSEGLPPSPLAPLRAVPQSGRAPLCPFREQSGVGMDGVGGERTRGGLGWGGGGGGGKESEGGGRGGGVLLLSEKKGKNIY